jgi:lipopolysaccharide/colanic/teichoic acid biosynthesis glycosyltransferase
LGTGTVTVRDDPRVLPLGRFLRKTKINELPQLLNILIGDMSVVGPRPLTRETFSAYGEDVQKMIGMARPGLSGVGSIIFRSEEDIMAGASASLHFYREVIAPYKGEMEAWFYANHSLKIYFLVIFVTIWIVFVPNSTLPWRVFKGLPRPPAELATELHYPST